MTLDIFYYPDIRFLSLANMECFRFYARLRKSELPIPPINHPACFAIPSPSLQDGDAVFFLCRPLHPSAPTRARARPLRSEQCIIPKAEPERMDLSHFEYFQIVFEIP